MISVVTCTYNTPADVLARTWASLKAQTFQDFEWIVVDDSPGWETYRQLYGFCADERYKVRIYRPHTPSGGNGSAKGGGGGGGGGVLNGTNSGAGGSGGDGYVCVVCI